MAFLRQSIAVDLGSVNTLIAVEGQGVTFNEPTVVAINNETRDIIAIGEEAHEMLGKTPGSINAHCPVKNGIIKDYDLSAFFLRAAVKKAISQTSLFRAITGGIIAVPGDINEMEHRALEDTCAAAGIRDLFFVEKPVAALYGMGYDISGATGLMAVILGGESCELGIVSLGGIVVKDTLKIGGTTMDNAVTEYIKKEYNLIISKSAAEVLRITLTDLSNPQNNNKKMEVRGRSIETNLPVQIEVSAEEITHCVTPIADKIITGITNLMQNTPPELMGDILDGGINMCGGLSLLNGLDLKIEKALGIRTYLDDAPMSCTCLGALNLQNEIKASKMRSA